MSGMVLVRDNWCFSLQAGLINTCPDAIHKAGLCDEWKFSEQVARRCLDVSIALYTSVLSQTQREVR